MKNSGILNLLLILIVLLIFIAGCKVTEEQITETTDEVADTGALIVESSPSLAQVYIGEEYRGDTPFALYNIPIGQYEITIKKDGYEDFKKTFTIKVGRTEEIDATLIPITIEETKPAPTKEEKPVPENISVTPEFNKINLSSFAMYFDFDKMLFTEARTEKSDIFSRRYNTYVDFTAFSPAKIRVLNKAIKDVKKEDCINADSAVAQLYSGQTLCIVTIEGDIVAIGGAWQISPTELDWVQFG